MIQSSVNQIFGSISSAMKGQKEKSEKMPEAETKQVSPEQAKTSEPVQVSQDKMIAEKAMKSLKEQISYNQERDKQFSELISAIQTSGRKKKGHTLQSLREMATRIEGERKDALGGKIDG